MAQNQKLLPCYPLALFRLRAPEEYESSFLGANRLVRLGFILVEDYSVQRIPGEKRFFPGFRTKLGLQPPGD